MVRYAWILVLVSFFDGFFALGQVDPCSQVFVGAAFVNPFDVTQLHVASVNTSTTEFFGYPVWEVFNSEGELVAEETLNYFGLVDTTWHVLNVLIPLDFDVDVLEVTLVLTWNSVEGTQTCSFAHTLQPWTPTEDAEASCLPLHVRAWGTSSPGSGFHLSLIDQETQDELESMDILADSDGVYPYGDVAEWCLPLEGCYVLEWTPLADPSGELPLYLAMSPGDWGTAWFDFATIAVGPTEPGQILMDFYEPGCGSATDEVESFSFSNCGWDGPNPTSRGVPVSQIWRGAEVRSFDGRLLGRITSQGDWPPASEGWVVLLKEGASGASVARVLVFRE